jgi:hypothetical protein
MSVLYVHDLMIAFVKDGSCHYQNKGIDKEGNIEAIAESQKLYLIARAILASSVPFLRVCTRDECR